MTFMYPAVFTEKAEGGYTVVFPDLPGAYAEGNDLDLAIADAQDVLFNWLTVEFEEENPELPMITPLEAVKTEPGQLARNISVHYRFHVGWDE